jgi:acyl-coenzyme A thioesterase PaaI-like protein
MSAGGDGQSDIADAVRAYGERLKAMPEITDRMIVLRRLAAEVRRAINEAVSTNAPDESVEEAIELVSQAVALLTPQAHDRPYDTPSEASLAGDPMGFLEFSPVFGPSNPVSAPIVISFEGDNVVGTATFGRAFEGPPNCLHGGFIAACFDDVLGVAQSLTGQPGMTGRLTIAYRSPTPLYREVRFVGWVDRVEGRKIFTKGAAYDGDRVCAEAEGLFITVPPERFLQMGA